MSAPGGPTPARPLVARQMEGDRMPGTMVLAP